MHHLLVDRAQLGRDLLADIGLVALDLVLLALKLLRALLLLGLERLGCAPAAPRRAPCPGSASTAVWIALLLGLERRGERLLAILKRGDLAAQRRGRRVLQALHWLVTLLEIDDGDRPRPEWPGRLRRRSEQQPRQSGGEEANLFIRIAVPTLKLKSLVSSPFCLSSALARSIRSGPNGEIQLTPMPIDRRGLAELPRKNSLNPGTRVNPSSCPMWRRRSSTVHRTGRHVESPCPSVFGTGTQVAMMSRQDRAWSARHSDPTSMNADGRRPTLRKPRTDRDLELEPAHVIGPAAKRVGDLVIVVVSRMMLPSTS